MRNAHIIFLSSSWDLAEFLRYYGIAATLVSPQRFAGEPARILPTIDDNTLTLVLGEVGRRDRHLLRHLKVGEMVPVGIEMLPALIVADDARAKVRRMLIKTDDYVSFEVFVHHNIEFAERFLTCVSIDGKTILWIPEHHAQSYLDSRRED